jgi:hypothetical protein
MGSNPSALPAMVYWLDEATRTARRGPRFAAAITIGGRDTFALPLGGIRFLVFDRHDRSMGVGGLDDAAIERTSLGMQRVDGIDAVGYRVTRTIPLWQADNDRPIELVDERWESPELKLVISSRSAADGGLSDRRVWADLGDGVPDGICLDNEGAVWYADVPNKRCVRVCEGGTVLDTINLNLGCFACMLGGVDGKTLFMVVREWRGLESTADRSRTGQVLMVPASAPRAGWP